MLSPLESAEGILVTAAIRDISVRKAAEKHLAQMEGRYRGLLEAAPDAMVVVNPARRDRAAQCAGGKAVRLPPRRTGGAAGEEHHSGRLRGTAGRGRAALRGRRAGAADRHRHRTHRAAQERQRFPHRDHAEPARKRGGSPGDGCHSRYQHTQEGRSCICCGRSRN